MQWGLLSVPRPQQSGGRVQRTVPCAHTCCPQTVTECYMCVYTCWVYPGVVLWGHVATSLCPLPDACWLTPHPPFSSLAWDFHCSQWQMGTA